MSYMEKLSVPRETTPSTQITTFHVELAIAKSVRVVPDARCGSVVWQRGLAAWSGSAVWQRGDLLERINHQPT
jgi:hypothetical protein